MDKKGNHIIILLITLTIFTNLIYIQNKSVGANSDNLNTSNESYKEKIIRFHVLANSDSVKDQELKLKVRDKVLDFMGEKFAGSESMEQTKMIVQENMEIMKNIALEEIKENGKDYDVEIKLEPYDFPTKSYGEFTLPAGQYQAVRILIGKARGENWWCVMFPPLCFVDARNGVTDKGTEDSMKDHLTQEEYNEISSNDDGKIQMKSKLLEVIKDRFLANTAQDPTRQI